MFLLDPIWAGATIAIIFILGMYIYYANPEANWGSSTQGQVLVDAVKAAHKVTETQDHVKNYRPKILVLTGNPGNKLKRLGSNYIFLRKKEHTIDP